MSDATTQGKGGGILTQGLMGTVVLPAIYGVILATFFGNFVPEMFSITMSNTAIPLSAAIPKAMLQALEPFMAITDPGEKVKISAFGWQFAGAIGGIFFKRMCNKSN